MNPYFSVIPNLLPHNDPRYKKWKKSLERRPASWSKGYTKETHPSIAKMVRTFKRRRIDNFAKWRTKMIEKGWIKVSLPPFEKSGDLAELIGVILGDGHIEKFPRTEGLTLACDSRKPGFISRYAKLFAKFFNKELSVSKTNKEKNCTRIRVYQKDISKRLNIPAGNRGKIKKGIPRWILENRECLKRYLRGLYEAEGSFCVHKPTSTYKFLFKNRNESLRRNVFRGLKLLGFHPHESSYQIQISRKKEVYRAKDLIKFRQY